MTRFELLPSDASPFDPTARPLRWSRRPTSTGTVTTDLGWDLHRLGEVPVAAGDLLRITTAAYLADRLTSRGRTFTRSIDLTVHVLDPTPWPNSATEQIADLLYWLTGDQWTVRAVPAEASEPPDPAPQAEEVTLLSGGLDSLCGALDRLNDGTSRLLLSHGDGTTAVRHAQRLACSWLEEAAGTPHRHLAVAFSQTGTKQESSTRSRSLLFASLAVAAAAGCGASRVIVPENGYTSINPPLVTARGGALSTRSTHPTTFARISALLATLGIAIEVANPTSPLPRASSSPKPPRSVQPGSQTPPPPRSPAESSTAPATEAGTPTTTAGYASPASCGAARSSPPGSPMPPSTWRTRCHPSPGPGCWRIARTTGTPSSGPSWTR